MLAQTHSLLAFLIVVAAGAAVEHDCEVGTIGAQLDAVSLLQRPDDKFPFPAAAPITTAAPKSSTRDKSMPHHSSSEEPLVKPAAVLAEFLAMTLFVMIGVGSAMGVANDPGWVLQVSMSFGFGITSLAYSIGHISGGQINPAVTFGLMLAGKLGFLQGCLNVVAQLLGSVLGAYLLTMMIPEEHDKTGGLGTNAVVPGLKAANAAIAEIFGTFLLMFVVYQTAVSPQTAANREIACLAIGLAVFLAHCVLIPIDGCSINPARSFGPALVRKLRYAKNTDGNFLGELWIFTVFPCIGSALAVLVSIALA